jgi:hypothetical protein
VPALPQLTDDRRGPDQVAVTRGLHAVEDAHGQPLQLPRVTGTLPAEKGGRKKGV